MRSHFWDLTESVITVSSPDIELKNVPKRRTETPEDETTTATENFLLEDEVEAMAVTRIINLKETVIVAESRGMPKQHAVDASQLCEQAARMV
jgi:hypothetical protein